MSFIYATLKTAGLMRSCSPIVLRDPEILFLFSVEAKYDSYALKLISYPFSTSLLVAS